MPSNLSYDQGSLRISFEQPYSSYGLIRDPKKPINLLNILPQILGQGGDPLSDNVQTWVREAAINAEEEMNKGLNGAKKEDLQIFAGSAALERVLSDFKQYILSSNKPDSNMGSV
eukprot:CAMPEP_0168529642 /NCGR_PEP_ID=MMETSP0405-20121227/14060_1 /TAXON_ID=498012 /ORGANISM="Trichosphaerium sp, Strain Am-I-7 wt" /LENGTH=114 /DNA_ID=CAMNT_0008553465 /DNA_START=481 /DNA_END=825 /DNA_ORIENTATION=+